ncbi:MAG: DNA repair protein RecO [Planctomycetota bacterium]
MRFKTDAIVIRRAPFSESSQVVHLLTAREGLVAALARGAYRSKSAFGGAIDLVTRGRADLGRRKSTELDVLHEFKIQNPYRGVRRDSVRWLAACYVIELIRLFSWQRDRETRFFPLLGAVLDALNAVEDTADSAQVDALLAFYASRLLAGAGLGPMLDACVVCGTTSLRGPVRFSPARGGVICRGCVGDRTARHCSEASLALHRRLAKGAGPAADRGIPPASLSETREHLDACIEYRLERPLQAASLLQSECASLR